MNDRALLRTADVARRLGKSVAWFRRQREHLKAAHGFPAPIAGLGLVWDPRAIDAWLDLQLPRPSAPAAAAAPKDLDALAAWEETLIGRMDLKSGSVVPLRPRP